LYDEGLIANGAALVLRGQLPARDFYAPYPPGAFLALALAFRIWGVRLLVERWFAAALGAAAGAISFWLIADLEPEVESSWPSFAMSWVASLAATLLLAAAWVTPVRSAALALVLAGGAALRAGLPRGRTAAAYGCGLRLGAATLCRLDFGLYSLAAGMAVWLLFAGFARAEPLGWRQRISGALGLAAGALTVSAPPLAWLVADGGRRAAASLFWWPISGTAAAHLPWSHHWPALLAVVLSLTLLTMTLPHWRDRPRRASLALWLLLVSLGFLCYALGTTNAGHLLPLRVTSLLLAALLGAGLLDMQSQSQRHLRGTAWVAILALLVTAIAASISAGARAQAVCHGAVPLPAARGAGVLVSRRQARDYARILTYLKQNSAPDSPLFCGAPRHDVFLKNDNLLYFLSGHPGGTYYWCLDAGVTSTRAVQAEMVRELETARVDFVALDMRPANCEPNAGGRSSGVRLLDDYLRRHFHQVAAWDDYQLFRRRVAQSQWRGTIALARAP
jgi:hypothetical protein